MSHNFWTKFGNSDHSVMQAAGLLLVLLLDLSDFLQEKNCIGEKKRKGIRNFWKEKIRELAVHYSTDDLLHSFIMQKIVLISYKYVD